MNKLQRLTIRAGAVILIGLMIAGLFGVLPATPASASSTSTTASFTPAVDAYVNASYPTTNYGTLTSLRTDASPVVDSFLRFSVSGLGGLPITQAQLKVYANSASTVGISAATVADNSWGETTITYGNMPALGSSLSSTSAVTTATWLTFDVTSYVTAEGTYSLALSTAGSTAISLASRESGANAPVLVLTLGSAVAATATATGIAPSPTDTATSVAAPTSTPAATAVGPTPTAISGQSATFNAAADAYVNASYPTTNYGTLTALRTDASPIVDSFVRFSVSGLGGLPITQAQLKVYANSGSTVGVTANKVVDNTWGEATISYGNMPAVGSGLATSSAVTAATWITYNVTSYVTAEGTYSFALSTPGSTAISLASRESGGNAPKLVLTLGGTSGATATATSVAPTPTTAPPTPTSIAPTATATSGSSGSIQHVFLVLMENKSYAEVWNTSSSPYITSLGNSYVRATNYHAVTHPSLPNYLDLYGGSNYSITTDCSPSSSCHINATNLADNLDAKGLTWKGYMESMPSPCYITTSGTYAPKHNPFVYFDDIRTNSTRCAAHNVPYTNLSTDLATAATTPNYSFITPNLCNDMHDCSVSTGDTWLKNNIPAILNSPACTVDKCLLVLTWDEDDSSQSNQVLTIFAGSGAKTGGTTSAVSYTHFSLLRTVENIFGVPTQTNNDAAASPMTDMLR